MMQSLTILDKFIKELDGAIKTVFPPLKRQTLRSSPAKAVDDVALTAQEKRHAAGLMRVNHAGEVCAQALYQGQALSAKLKYVKDQMTQAAQEETDHLAWCEERLCELNSQPSVLNPIWYAGSLLMGMMAGMAGDKISLGFVAETERQVGAHLQRHLQALPEPDKKSKAIVNQMADDEAEHAAMALAAGAKELPYPIKNLMGLVSKVMTQSSYYF